MPASSRTGYYLAKLCYPKSIFENARHMKNACGNHEADNGKTTERNRMENRKKEKMQNQ